MAIVQLYIWGNGLLPVSQTKGTSMLNDCLQWQKDNGIDTLKFEVPPIPMRFVNRSRARGPLSFLPFR